MRRLTRRARRAGQHDAEHVGVLVLIDEGAEEGELGCGTRREPLADVAGRPRRPVRLEGLQAAQRVAQLALEREEVVLPRLDLHEQAVEGGDVDSHGVAPALERLNQRRPRAGERIEDGLRPRQVAREQRLDELRHVLAEVRMEPVDVLRALALGQIALRPGERRVDVELTVEGVLRRCHRPDRVLRGVDDS